MNTKVQIPMSVRVIIPVILLATSASAKTFEREVTREFITQPGQQLLIEVGSGNIDVQAGDPGTAIVQVLMSVRAGDAEQADQIFDAVSVDFSEDSDSISTVVQKKDSSWKSWFGVGARKSPDIRVVAVCPPEFNLTLDSGSGNISVQNVSGTIGVDTGSGNVTGSRLSGDLSVDTGSGSIALDTISGPVLLDTGSGNIRARELNGSLNADTGSGSIDAQGAISRFFADTGSGSVTIDSSVPDLQPSSADTGSGNVRFLLHPSTNADFLAESSSGSIQADFHSATTVASSKNSLHLTLNSGGPTVTANTGSGSISLSDSKSPSN